MSSSRPHRGGVLAAAHLLFSAVLLASVPIARADTITYNIADYPDNQTDQISGGTDHVSGSITTDGYIGTNFQVSDIISGTLTITTPNSTYTDTLDMGNSIFIGNVYVLTATATQLIVPTFGGFQLIGDELSVWLGYVSTITSGHPATVFMSDYAGGIGAGKGGTELFDNREVYSGVPNTGDPITGGPSVPGQYIGLDPMVIATAVPEPTSLTLLVSALLGLAAAVYLRWRRAKA